MRTWRKVYSNLLESSRAQTLSEGALNLFLFLVIAQDDSGYYPWDPAKVKRLTVIRSWSIEEVKGFAEELVTAGMAGWKDGGIELRRGAELNGIPRKDVEPEMYPRERHVNATLTPREQRVPSRAEQSREEKNREEQRRA